MLFNSRSAYSLLQSTLDVESYVKEAKRLGYQAIGLADVNVLYGALQFYKACQKEQVKALIGITLKIPGFIESGKNFSLLVYARDYSGYLSLIALSKAVNQSPVNHTEIRRIIAAALNSLVLITPAKEGELDYLISHDREQEACQWVDLWQDNLSKNRLFLGISIYPYNELEVKALQHFAKNQGIGLIVSQLIETLVPEDAVALKFLQAIDANETLDESVFVYRGAHYLYHRDDLVRLYQEKGLEEAVDNAVNLAKSIDLQLKMHQTLLPRFSPPEGVTSFDYLKDQALQGLQRIDKLDNQIYLDRMNHELAIIQQMGFVDYFLIVWEIIGFCRYAKIRTGPGRGSAAGSLIAYLLDITQVDPIEYGLLFERFLNPERYNMPDIDIDIPDDKRYQVFNFIEKHYGHKNVAKLITFGTFGAKQAIRDCLRVLGKSKNEQSLWSKAIPSKPSIKLQEAFKLSDTLRRIVHQSKENQALFDLALAIEGLPRHTSIHASGIVICDQDLSQLIPVLDRQGELQLTQFAMEEVEELGLLKMDFLGLRNLQLLDDILLTIRREYQKEIDIRRIDLSDKATLALFQKADTAGVFQFESSGIRQVLQRLYPESLEDIIAVNALYRPGPMQQIQHFIARKHGKETIDYLHPLLKPILEKTYGIIVYQEQVMQICRQLAGFTLGQADLLRRAMGKKQISIMDQEKTRFIEGALERGIQQQTAEQIFQYIYQFANYGFNRSHAVVYSTLAFQLAYLKAHYPAAFYVCLLNQGTHSSQGDLAYLPVAKRVLGRLLPLDINLSKADLSIDQGSLRLGLMAIKGMRAEVCRSIIQERELVGKYQNYFDFLSRLDAAYLNEKTIQPLIDAGALDCLGYNRASLTHNLPAFIQYFKFSNNQISLFKEMEPKVELVEDWTEKERLARQRAVLGNQWMDHPMSSMMTSIESSSQYTLLEQISAKRVRSTVTFIAFVEEIRKKTTKRQEEMAFLTVSDPQAEAKLVVFPNVFQRIQTFLQEGKILCFKGRIDQDLNGQKQIIVQSIERLTDQIAPKAPTNKYQTVFIRLEKEVMALKLDWLKQLCLQNPGPLKVIIVDSQKKSWQLDEHYNLSAASRIQRALEQAFGKENIAYR